MLELLATAYNYNYSLPTNGSSTGSGTGFGWLLALWIVILVLVVVAVVSMWKIFVKAGRPGWAALIPIYNSWVLFEVSGKPGWWALAYLLSFIPLVGWIVPFVLYILAMLELAKRFGKSTVFAVFGLILFSFVGFLVLGFGSAKYRANRGNHGHKKAPAGGVTVL